MADDPGTPLLPHLKYTAPKPKGCIQQRYMFAFLSFVGFFNVYVLRVNLSVAMVAMVNGTVEKGNATEILQCPDDGRSNSSSSSHKEGEFDWSTTEQGIILSSFFYGYIVTQLPGGIIAEKFGGKWPFGIGVLMTGVLSLLTPLAARTHVYLFVALRVLEGVFEGVTFPAFLAMSGRWAPPNERSVISTSMIGCQVGTVVSLPVSAWLCQTLGWPYVFYIFGAVTCVWFIFWASFVFNSPSEHPRISEEEREYIVTSIGDHSGMKKGPIPWRGILTSLPVWSIAIAHMCINYIFATLLIDLPTYMKTVLHFEISKNGLLSALPYLANATLAIAYSPLADWLITKGYLRTITVRKMSTALGTLLPSAFIIGTAWIGCDYYLGVALLTICCGTLGFNSAGYIPNCIDISPRFSGAVFGFVNTFGQIPSITAPLAVGAITKNNQTQEQWRYIFFIAGGLCACGSIPYLLFTKVDRAPWSIGSHDRPPITESVNETGNRQRNIQNGHKREVEIE